MRICFFRSVGKAGRAVAARRSLRLCGLKERHWGGGLFVRVSLMGLVLVGDFG